MSEWLFGSPSVQKLSNDCCGVDVIKKLVDDYNRQTAPSPMAVESTVGKGSTAPFKLATYEQLFGRCTK